MEEFKKATVSAKVHVVVQWLEKVAKINAEINAGKYHRIMQV